MLKTVGVLLFNLSLCICQTLIRVSRMAAVDFENRLTIIDLGFPRDTVHS